MIAITLSNLGSSLRSEKQALDALLQTPLIPNLPQHSPSDIDKALLDDNESAIFTSLTTQNNITEDASRRLNTIQRSLGPSIDAFADGVHKVAQYRNAAENVAGAVLTVCSRKMTEREIEGRKKALGEESGSPKRDLQNVLRGLSRADR
jgi:kinetochore protein Mis13/DSN1